MKVHVKLALHGKSNAQILVDTDNYTNDMTASAYFTAAPIVAQITATKNAATNMRTKITAAYSHTYAGDVKTAREALERQLDLLAHLVEGVANDPAVLDANRLNIVHAAGMHEKNTNHPGRHKFGAEDGSVLGSTVLLKAEGGAKSNLWAYTADVINFTNRIDVEPTTPAHTEVPGCLPNTEYAFFHKGIHVHGNTAWEGPILFTTSRGGATPTPHTTPTTGTTPPVTG